VPPVADCVTRVDSKVNPPLIHPNPSPWRSHDRATTLTAVGVAFRDHPRRAQHTPRPQRA
jgi:hypothetical protein